MFRWLAVVLLLCGATFLLMNMALNEGGWKSFLQSDADSISSDDPTKGGTGPTAAGVQAENVINRQEAARNARNQQVIYEASIRVVDKQDVCSEKDGILRFIAVEMSPSEVDQVSAQEKGRLIKEGRLIPWPLGYLMIQEAHPNLMRPEHLVRFPDSPDKKYRLLKAQEALLPNLVRVGSVMHTFRKLEVGDRVERGQLVALVDPKLALDELLIKASKLDAADAERTAAEKTRDEARKRMDAIDRARLAARNSVSDDEARGAELTWQRYIYEEKAKHQAVRQAERETNAALTTLRMHEIRADISGVVKVIYKNRGDGVKAIEPVLQIQNTELLRVEGMAELQETRGLKNGMVVSVEPSLPAEPRLVLRGHSGEINCVAVTMPQKDGTAWIVSGSEDRSLRVWDSKTGRELWTVECKSPIRSLACTGPAATDRNLLVAGFADGVARLYDLNNMKMGSVLVGQCSQGSVNSVAFSRDGKLCLTGGEDRSIQVRKVDMVEGRPAVDDTPLHTLMAAHTAAVTCVRFILPENPTDRIEFLSTGRDAHLRIWTMDGGSALVKTTLDLDQRSGDVPVLGSDGKRVLLDQGPELRLHSLAEGSRIEGWLRNPPGSASFTTMALFAPDGKTILTNSQADGRVQLWRTPPQWGRGSELRQLVWTTGATTCGAFAPKDPFVVTGTQDQCVLVWDMPKEEEIEHRLQAQITYIEKMLDSSSRQVRLWAELKNPPDWVIPGSTATIVIPTKE